MAYCHEAESIADLGNFAGGEGAERGRGNFGKKAVNAQKRCVASEKKNYLCGLTHF